MAKRKSKNYRSNKLNTSAEESEACNYLKLNKDDDDLITRYRLEGVLLYDFGLSHAKMYQVIMNLVNDGVISLIQKSDGEYYKVKIGGD